MPCIGDTKIFAGVPSDPSGVGRMGAFVACGNTLPRARETVLGVEGGDRGGRVGMWDPRTGTGTVEAVKGQYTDAEGKCRVEALLFEEFGAMSAGVEELLMRVAKVAGRKLTWWQYDQTSWSAREWMPFALQRLSVQLWTALADEAQRAIAAHAAAAILLASSACTPPAVAISQPMRQAVLEVADAAYPVVASVRADAAGPFAVQAAALFAAASPLEVARTAEKLSDALLSIPPERLDAAAASWKSAYADVARSSSCNVPLPPTDALRVAASAWDAAAASVDLASVAAAARVARPLLSAVVRNEEAICLPPLPAFETAALATADALASADPAALSAASRQARAALGSAAIRGVGEARAEQARREAEAAAPKRCFTMSCYDYSLDTGKGRGGIEGYYRPLPDV
ncbi:hypothetical protein EMIHUDRAFT_112194 [Emiliania huxleyi CCMP1516]|uniref:Uncharacterized protein n=2 Tax=Emiliania huxleyi TaxID=2903 RepID=A0A0D3KAE6_EMIH1|nr:hypothetical protein EMIHUDRAFT_112194 [Emiliania huxleyi CCMP1516]EOD32731.1 hypothetical protein EMIHUDRAFT_112194 [Emiliania huxleyi CCMP1516]|eukprot:XP_005785160.1 hypothetical protein EMIHUDRAFT_112194 [Emiliania huxleyi CCMP1516]